MQATTSNLTPSATEKFLHIYEIRNRIASRIDENFMSGSSELAADIRKRIEPSGSETHRWIQGTDSCADRQTRWDSYIASGDIAGAKKIAAEMWDLGARGTDMAFKSKMLGLSFPPVTKSR